MHRQLLRVVLVLGVLVTLVGGTGLYAVFSDQASTGTNTFDSGAVARAADLRIAGGQINPGPFTCETFVEDALALGLISFSDAQPGSHANGAFCLKNAGSAPLDVTMLVNSLTNMEIECTGDEASVDDTCDRLDAGELSANLVVQIVNVACATSEPVLDASTSSPLDDLWGTPIAVPNGIGLAPGATYCGYWNIHYPLETDADLVQAAQSDRVTWVFDFIGTAQ